MKRIVRTALLIVVLLAITPFNDVRAQHGRTIGDKDMKLVDFEELAYPSPARAAHVQGVVIIQVSLDSQGKVLEPTAISGTQALIPDCLANAKRWRFQPNAQNAAVIVYNFRLTEMLSKSGCSHFALRPPNFATITGCVPEIQ